MALLSDYTAGTITIAANSTAVTGSGTAWLSAGFREGDVLYASGFSGIALTVNSNTSLTLAQPWRGGALNASAYRLRFQGDGSRVSAQARQLIEMLAGSGNLEAFGALAGVANRLPFFTGAGTLGLATLTPHARAVLALAGGAGKFIRSADAESAVMQDIVGNVAQSGGVPTNALFERGSNANGEYVRFADGTQLCRPGGAIEVSVSASSYVEQDWNYPASFAGASDVPISWRTAGTAANNASFMAAGCNVAALAGSGTRTTLVFRNGATSTLTMRASLVAMGRWF